MPPIDEVLVEKAARRLTLLSNGEPGCPSVEAPSEWVIDYYDGPVFAVVRCRSCGELALLDLLDWDDHQEIRVFAASRVELAPLELLLRNVGRGSCDPSRYRSEIEAFAACAGPVERVVGWRRRDDRVIATAVPPSDFAPPHGELEERLPDREDDRWFRVLGLSKGAV